MTRWLIQGSVLLVLLVMGGADLAYHYPRLPERVATHFNASGVPDGWSSRTGFLTMAVLTLVGPALLLAAVTVMVLVLPARFINVPAPEYWLAPERIAFTRSSIAGLVGWMGLVLCFTMVSVNHLIMAANLKPQPRLGFWIWVLLGVDLVLAVGLIVPAVLRFRRPG